MTTHMHPTCNMSKNNKSKRVDHKVYIGMICSLIYTTSSRLDILFSVCLCVRFQSDFRETHLTTIKRILIRNHQDYKLVRLCDAGNILKIT